MSDILSQVFVLPVRIALIAVAIILILLWLVAIIWVNRDARLRDAPTGFWTVVAIIPVAGLVAYCLLRPPMTNSDATEQDMSLELMSRQLAEYGNCPQCGHPVYKDYIVCPTCRTKLRNVCPVCKKPLEPHWIACPYCGATAAKPKPKARR